MACVLGGNSVGAKAWHNANRRAIAQCVVKRDTGRVTQSVPCLTRHRAMVPQPILLAAKRARKAAKEQKVLAAATRSRWWRWHTLMVLREGIPLKMMMSNLVKLLGIISFSWSRGWFSKSLYIVSTFPTWKNFHNTWLWTQLAREHAAALNG